MIVKPTVTSLLDIIDNRFELVVVASKRARQIAAGDTPMTNVEEDNPVTLAVNEISEGKVKVC